jgi:hypothetical protein
MKPTTGLMRAAGAMLGVLLLTIPLPAQTNQNFTVVGTPYGATKIGTVNAPVTMAPGPGGVGNFLRLLSTVDNPGSNTIVFDRTDSGAFTQIVADFDFRMTQTPGQTPGEGMGFALLDTAVYDKFGPVPGPAEEPAFGRSLGIGFDIHQDGGELNANHVSVHFNNVKLAEVDAGSVALGGGQWIHAHIVVRPGGGNSDVSVTLTPEGASAVVVIPPLVVNGLEPYESRAYFAARKSASNTADHDLANVQVAFTADPVILGQWSALMPLPIVAIHSTLLPNGKVICWDRNVTADIIPRLIDTATLDIPPGNINVTSAAAPPGVPTPLEIFCSAHTLLADGRLFVAGGHNGNDGEGLDTALIYDSFANNWAQLPNMGTGGRWYPAVTLLPNGDPIVFSGEMTGPGINKTVQSWQFGSASWKMVDPNHGMATFPYMHLVSGGKIFHTGPETGTEFLDPATGIWTAGPTRKTGYCDYGGSVMYDKGKILVVGGGTPQASAEVIDLSDLASGWKKLTASMAYPRRQVSTLMLPDGTVLITGGSSYSGFNDEGGAVFPAEIWDPGTGKFRTVAGANFKRVYHSETLLLPDGRVLSLGSGHPPNLLSETPGFNCEVYSPPYLFKNGGVRPALAAAPSKVLYGQVFPVTSVDAASITSVSMIAASSVTHTNNFTQRFLRPTFTLGANTVNITTPNDPNLCPPGLYLLFLLNSDGVPSPGKMVIVGYNQPPVAGVGGNITAEATKAAGADVQFDGTSSTDPDNNLTTYEWLEGVNLLATGATPTVTLGVGVHTITLRVTDAGSLTNTKTFTVTIQDTTAPVLQTLTAAPSLLRSVSGSLLPITLQATAMDDVDPSPSFQAFNVTSTEAASGLTIPGGDQTPDWQLPGGLSVNLRAERYAILRRYTIDARATDAKGNQSNTKSVDVRVRGKWFP